MTTEKALIQRYLPWFLLVLLAIAVTGCGSVKHTVDFQNDYMPGPDTKIEVGSVSNETGEAFDIDIERMIADALTKELEKKELLWTGSEGRKLILVGKIVEYKKGSAFKRWMMPGWGSTVLSIQCDLMNGDNLVGTVKARRTVSFGGGYTIGAWKRIFASLSKDVVKDLRKQIK